jgi:DNA adenine methylase
MPDPEQIGMERRRRSADTFGWSVFGYPGNKAKLAAWILPHFPDHRCYVEPFGGAAGVLANKPESKVEVYNDVDGDLVQFFEVLRDRGAEIVEWLTDVPYARENYEKWAPEWYDGWRPDDPVKRAGVFFYLRQTAFGGKYRYKGGFATSTTRNQAMTYRNQVDRLHGFADRFRGQVVIENLDWRDALEKYDDEDTLFYLDPPYADAKLRYRYGEDFDHEALASALEDTEARWAVSYGAAPEPVREVASTVVERTTKYQMAAGKNGDPDEVTETLLLNYDPDRVKQFVDDQAELDQFGAGSSDDNCAVSTANDHSGGHR